MPKRLRGRAEEPEGLQEEPEDLEAASGREEKRQRKLLRRQQQALEELESLSRLSAAQVSLPVAVAMASSNIQDLQKVKALESKVRQWRAAGKSVMIDDWLVEDAQNQLQIRLQFCRKLEDRKTIQELWMEDVDEFFSVWFSFLAEDSDRARYAQPQDTVRIALQEMKLSLHVMKGAETLDTYVALHGVLAKHGVMNKVGSSMVGASTVGVVADIWSWLLCKDKTFVSYHADEDTKAYGDALLREFRRRFTTQEERDQMEVDPFMKWLLTEMRTRAEHLASVLNFKALPGDRVKDRPKMPAQDTAKGGKGQGSGRQAPANSGKGEVKMKERQGAAKVWQQDGTNPDCCAHCGSSRHFERDCHFFITCDKDKRHPDANPNVKTKFLDSDKGKEYKAAFGYNQLGRRRLMRKTTGKSDWWMESTLALARMVEQRWQEEPTGSNVSVVTDYVETSGSKEPDVAIPVIDGVKCIDVETSGSKEPNVAISVAPLRRLLDREETVAESAAHGSDASLLESHSLAAEVRERVEKGLLREVPTEPPFSEVTGATQGGGRTGNRTCTRFSDRCVDTDRVVFEDGSMLVQLPDDSQEPHHWRSINLLFDDGSFCSNYVSRSVMDWVKVLSRRSCQVDVCSAIGKGQHQVTEEVEFFVSVLVDKGKRICLRIRAYVVEDMVEDIILGIRAQILNKRCQHLREENHHIIIQCWEIHFLQEVQREKGSVIAAAVHTGVEGTMPAADKVHGSEGLKVAIWELLTVYKDVFSTDLREEPCLMDPMCLVVDDAKWKTPRSQGPPRRLGIVRGKEMLEQIRKKLAAKVIRPSQATHYSHPHLVRKSATKWRFTCDLRYLNQCTTPERFPIPNISEMMNRIGDKRPTLFSVVDATSGYFQAALAKDSIPYTAFMTEGGIYEYLRVPQGLCGAPSYFQRQMMEKVLRGLIYQGVEVYLDDILQFASDEATYIAGLRRLLQRMRDFKVTLNPEKCEFGLNEIEYVGHTLNSQGKHFDRSKLQDFVDFPKPQTEGELKSFLGLANWFREHIKNHSIVVKPLMDMTKDYRKQRRLIWKEEQEAAFVQIKKLINECPRLFFMDAAKPVHVYTDASDVGFGAYVCQLGEDGKELPVAFSSRTFNPTQLRWSVNEREAYAVYAGITKFHYLLRDCYFVLHTDHKNLTYIKDHASPKVMRWKMQLQEYNFLLEHIDGVSNVVADVFSRTPTSPLDDADDGLPDATMGSAAQYLSRIWNSPLEDEESEGDVEEQQYVAAHSFVDMTDDQYHAITKCHNVEVGHHGVERTVEMLRTLGFDWKYMRNHVKKYLRECDTCQKNVLRDFEVGCSRFTTGGKYPFETIGFDHVGPFTGDKDGYKYALLVICIFSRFVDIYPVKNQKAETTAGTLLKHFGHYDTPAHIRTDGAPGFKSEVIAEVMRMLDTEHSFTAPDSHQENGIVERANRELNRWMRDLLYDKVKGDKSKWVSLIPYAMRIHNATKIATIGCSPAQLVFGRSIDLHPAIFCDRVLNSKDDVPMQDWVRKQVELQQDVIARAQALQQQLHDKHVSSKPQPITEYAIGDLVLLGWPVTRFNPHGRPTKWDTLYRGPYKVLGHTNQSYRLLNLATGKEVAPKNVHLLKPFYYDVRRTDPVEVAMKDLPEGYLVEEILAHKGDLKKRKSDIQVLVKWLGYEEPDWQPWKNVRENSLFHEYLRKEGYPEQVPAQFRSTL